MKSSSAIYINIIKLPNQLKLDYKLIKNNNILKSDQASFLVYDETMTKDILFKIQALQKENKHNYISTLLNTKEQFICSDAELSNFNPIEYDFVKLYNKNNVVTPKNVVFETKHYFDKSGLDYIFSPYQILTHYLLDNPSKNNVLVLIISNIVYIMITDEISTSIYTSINELTPFEEIKHSKFYDDEIKAQVLFDEIYFFELQEILKSVLEEFYTKYGKSFIEKINILYTLKQLDTTKIEALKEEFMMDVSYHHISLENYMYELANSKTTKKSFILPRKKPANLETIGWISAASMATIGTLYLIYNFYNTPVNIPQSTSTEQTIQTTDITKNIILPNHISQNNTVSSLIQELFSTIPYNVVLKELIVNSDGSILVCDFLEKDLFVKLLKSEMLKYYEDSSIRFDDEESILPIYTGIIKNTSAKYVAPSQPIQNLEYKQTSFSYTLMQDTIQPVLPENSQLIYVKTYLENGFSKNLFELNLEIQTPSEFFELIEKINSLNYSVTVESPIRFVKENDVEHINLKIYISFNQSS
ncbi:hypothetical protein [Arcobacter sp. FWKO B]|uniref:hypothetical protein n=1 Tax=Arcobacter sp. FWKO B TaxID=2593672 RepID=UPI0018A539F7|nr:hypothetical protein [Arcobacter sp. FWKO B]QOG12670.1 hypothetical protein FWKOB_08130 [Arcobacter sp. FWKO B]